MFFRQYYLGCLSHASYLIGDGGKAVVVDPQRDVDEYLEDARAQGLTITDVIETHLHADFVSGHRELAARTGARIWVGHRGGVEFEHVAVKDGMELRLGRTLLRFLETPGHTPEGISVVITDESVSPRPQKVLTGDTLFIGDVGRPDLVASRGFTAAEMAEMLHDSLHGKLLTLPDDVEVWPAHGAGSACGRYLSNERSSTIGQQKLGNWALRAMPRAEFVALMTENLPPPPRYFPHDADTNRRGPRVLGELELPPALAPAEVAARQRAGAIVLDVRDAATFARGHVPGAVNLGLGGQFAPWAGALLPVGAPIVLVAEEEAALREATLRLARVGHESVVGHLAGGMGAWAHDGLAADQLEQVTVQDLAERMGRDKGVQVLDVRRPGEHEGGHVPGAKSFPLDGFAAATPALDPTRPTYVICASGYRSVAALSLLRRRGFTHVVNVVGGTSAWVAAGYPVERAAALTAAPPTSSSTTPRA